MPNPNIEKSFLVCGTPRTGTNLFLSLLDSTRFFGILDEHLGKGRLTEYLDVPYEDLCKLPDSTICAIFEKIQGDTQRNGIWGCKVFLDRFYLLQRYMHAKGLGWDAFKVIWIRRKNMLKQAISFAKAVELQQFSLESIQELSASLASEKEISLLIRTIEKYYCKFSLWDFAWQFFFDTHGIVPHIVYYEDFEGESGRADVVQGVLDFLEIPYESPLHVSTEYQKQSTDWNAQIYEEFLCKVLTEEGVLYLPPTTNLLDSKEQKT